MYFAHFAFLGYYAKLLVNAVHFVVTKRENMNNEGLALL